MQMFLYLEMHVGPWKQCPPSIITNPSLFFSDFFCVLLPFFIRKSIVFLIWKCALDTETIPIHHDNHPYTFFPKFSLFYWYFSCSIATGEKITENFSFWIRTPDVTMKRSFGVTDPCTPYQLRMGGTKWCWIAAGQIVFCRVVESSFTRNFKMYIRRSFIRSFLQFLFPCMSCGRALFFKCCLQMCTNSV